MTFKVLVAALLTVLCGTPLRAQAPADTPAFGESVEVNVVNVDVFVTDKSGRRVTDLQKADFELLEDGKPVPITNFEALTERRAAQETASPAPRAAAAPALAPTPEDVLNLVVLFDNSNLKPANRTRAARQLREFLTHNLSPGDRVMLVTQGLGLKVHLPFSSDPAAIAGALDEIQRTAAQGLQSDQDRRFAFQAIMSIQQASVVSPDPLPCPLNIATPAHTYAESRRDEVRRALGSLTVLVNSLSGVPGRKALLHVSDGLPLIPGEEVFEMLVALCGGGGTSGLGTYQNAGVGGLDTSADTEGEGGATLPRDTRDFDPLTVYDARLLGPRAYQAATQAPIDAQGYNVTKDLRKLAAHANAHRVTLYTLQASGLGAPDNSDLGTAPSDQLFRFPAIGAALRNNNRDTLQFLADETGGRAILDTNDFRPDLARMREDFESYYSLGFTPSHTGDGREHKIEVKIKRPGTRLRYRQSYRDKPAVEKLVDRTLAALYHGFDDNPLNIAVEIGEQTPGAAGTWTVPVRLRIPMFKLAILNRDETYEGALKLFVVTGTPDGANSPVRQLNVPLKIPRKEVLSAMGQYYVYNLTLTMKPGEHRLALAVRDEVAATTSYLSRPVTVGEAVAAGPQGKP